MDRNINIIKLRGKLAMCRLKTQSQINPEDLLRIEFIFVNLSVLYEKDDFSESCVVQKLWNLRWLKPLPLLDQIIFTPNIELRISQMYHYSAFHGVLIFEILIQAIFQNS